MLRRTMAIAPLLVFLLPSAAYAAAGDVPVLLSSGAGGAALLAAAALLLVMLSLRRLASGAAIADNISFAVLAVICLAASVLAGWVERIAPAGVSAEHVRLGADLLALTAIVLFGVYFYRVRQAMVRFHDLLAGEDELLAAVLDPDAEGVEAVDGRARWVTTLRRRSSMS